MDLGCIKPFSKVAKHFLELQVFLAVRSRKRQEHFLALRSDQDMYAAIVHGRAFTPRVPALNDAVDQFPCGVMFDLKGLGKITDSRRIGTHMTSN